MEQNENNPWLSFVLDLIENTKNNKIEWKAIPPITTLYKPNENVVLMLDCKFADTEIVVYEKTYERTTASRSAAEHMLNQLHPGSNKMQAGFTTERVNKPVIQIITRNEQDPVLGWNIENVHDNTIRNLIDTINYSLTGANAIFKKYSKKDKTIIQSH